MSVLYYKAYKNIFIHDWNWIIKKVFVVVLTVLDKDKPKCILWIGILNSLLKYLAHSINIRLEIFRNSKTYRQSYISLEG